MHRHHSCHRLPCSQPHTAPGGWVGRCGLQPAHWPCWSTIAGGVATPAAQRRMGGPWLRRAHSSRWHRRAASSVGFRRQSTTRLFRSAGGSSMVTTSRPMPRKLRRAARRSSTRTGKRSCCTTRCCRWCCQSQRYLRWNLQSACPAPRPQSHRPWRCRIHRTRCRPDRASSSLKVRWSRPPTSRVAAWHGSLPRRHEGRSERTNRHLAPGRMHQPDMRAMARRRRLRRSPAKAGTFLPDARACEQRRPSRSMDDT
mmetsp:Transcript_37082/g.122908  ORF Transcript_37082/g.122908 Transcript_37082/m.122908 type:complete len:255 (+) Transcript_37082:1519-2283(+)